MNIHLRKFSNIDDGSLKYSLERDGKREGVVDYVFYSDALVSTKNGRV